MLSDGLRTYTWEHGRQLQSVTVGNTAWYNLYDENGIRTERARSTVSYKYSYEGGKLKYMSVGANKLYFTYDFAGAPLSVNYNGTDYYYVTNLQGDVVAILNAAGTAVVTYTYDAWGNPLTQSGSLSSTLGTHNPLRYRGYVYDTETQLYYLQSRYYDPQIGRFINADSFASTGQGVIGTNMFAYCINNPVNMSDAFGMLPSLLPEHLQGLENLVQTPYGELFYTREVNARGSLKELWIDSDGKIRWSRHHTNHGNSKEHPVVPHDHDWYDDDNGNNTQDPKWQHPNPGFKAPDSNNKKTVEMAAKTVSAFAVGYVIYIGVKWTIATLAAPATAGGSFVVAGVMP